MAIVGIYIIIIIMEIEFNLIILALSFCRCIIIIIMKGFVISIVAGTYIYNFIFLFYNLFHSQ